MKDLLKNKKLMIIIGGAVLIIAIAIISITLIINNNNKEKVVTLEEKLNEYGSEFYLEHHYIHESNRKILKNYKDTGFNITVTSLNVILPIDEELETLLKEKECNYDETKIIIYPKEPYGEKDYTIKVDLACKK